MTTFKVGDKVEVRHGGDYVNGVVHELRLKSAVVITERNELWAPDLEDVRLLSPSELAPKPQSLALRELAVLEADPARQLRDRWLRKIFRAESEVVLLEFKRLANEFSDFKVSIPLSVDFDLARHERMVLKAFGLKPEDLQANPYESANRDLLSQKVQHMLASGWPECTPTGRSETKPRPQSIKPGNNS